MIDQLLAHICAHPHMWFTFGVVLAAIYLYASERLSLIMTSILIVCAFWLFFHLYPMTDEAGIALFNTNDFLLGFSNPALIAVLSLLVMG